MFKSVRKNILPLSIIMLSLAGCSSVDHSEEIENEIPKEFKLKNTDKKVAQNESWWGLLKDRDLEYLIERAILMNADIDIAAAQVMKAESILRGSEASFFPVFDLALKDTKGKNTVAQNSDSGISKLKTGNLLLSYEVDLWGRLSNIRDINEYNLRASKYDQEIVRRTVIANVVSSYLSIRQFDEEISALTELKENSEKSLAVINFSVQEGYAENNELEKSKSSLAQASILLERKLEERLKVENSLSVLIGDPNYRRKRDDNYKLIGLVAPDEGLASSLLLTRPDIVAAENRLKAAGANIDVAKKSFFPQISLTGALGTQSSQMRGLMRSGNDVWSYGIGLDLPIFDGGLRWSNLLQSEAEEKEALAQYKKTIRVAFSEVNDALVSLEANKRVYHQSLIALKSSMKTLAFVTDRYQRGYSSYTETLKEANEMLNSRLNEIDNRYKISKDIILFNRALGY